MKTWIALAVVANLFLLSSCNVHFRAGSVPNIDLLENALQLGESTEAEVASTLGVPFGRGQSMLPIDDTLKTVWSYEYMDGDLNNVRQATLYVFFNKNLYDGYLFVSWNSDPEWEESG